MLKSIALREADIGFTLQELHHPDIRCEPLCNGPLVAHSTGGLVAGRGLRAHRHHSLADSRLVCITKADSLGRKLEATSTS